MSAWPEGRAIVYCEGSFQSPEGKTAHGLVRGTRRYVVAAVIDSHCAGSDAGERLDGRRRGIPVAGDLSAALAAAERAGGRATHFVIGLAPDGGRLAPAHRAAVREAIERGVAVDSGLHDFLEDDPELGPLARRQGVRIRDVRRPPPRERLHFFSGKIAEVRALKVAVLGTDSAVGKRTTAWALVEALQAEGVRSELIGTGQTAWMQGARYGVVLDALINDFVAGEIEHAVWSAWNDDRPRVLVIEGQGSLMHPAYPGGFEILAAARPDVVILQHAPARRDHDGFPGWPIPPLVRQIQVVELLSDRPVVAVTMNHEGLAEEEIRPTCRRIAAETGRPAVDILVDGPGALLAELRRRLD